eukprot:1267707-Rhodomonas_salina.1
MCIRDRARREGKEGQARKEGKERQASVSVPGSYDTTGTAVPDGYETTGTAVRERTWSVVEFVPLV